ncbi:hypothetical protein L1987_86117 [Smallanthus sonchifolius]|uniref:Uncharacterized protein n=1 Tax=Smallanthus sonchifolius TaxID=185202 RepID=A0ACB8XZ70_9ASTR|nr:hypothetical protein L1987_86117 [Smallanthus sonchifolius]
MGPSVEFQSSRAEPYKYFRSYSHRNKPFFAQSSIHLLGFDSQQNCAIEGNSQLSKPSDMCVVSSTLYDQSRFLFNLVMGSVYNVLKELFPQVDSRLLKAVSLEHYKDADAAVEVVLVEIIPSFPDQPLTNGSSSNSQSSLGSFDDGGKSVQIESTMGHVVVNPRIAEHSTDATEALYSGFSGQLNCHTVVEPANLEPTAISFDHDANTETEANCGEIFGESISVSADSDSPILICENVSLDNHDQEDESALSSMLTRSEQICSTGYLDEVIEESKNNKKTLGLAMDSVIDLMKAVESKEKAAEQAKEDATRGCSDILAKVDEVKHALLRAKEANDMHAGEVNAEKAILATELRELQLRLFTLSDDKNRSLEILDGMRRALEVRMAAALEEIASADDEKLERERSAREALMYQENEMEKVVEESKKLKLEAEENSKLQEFLMDRGHAVDILQGEIAVKYQDVLLLKEKFDKRIPLSGSLFSSPKLLTLGSSSSSFRSTMTPLEPEIETYETLKKSSELGYSYGILDKSSKSDASPIEIANGIDELKGFLDNDGWELFDNDGLLIR